MKRIVYLSIIAYLLICNPTYGETPVHNDESGDVHMSVSGMVCEFCVHTLKTTFTKKAEVKAIDVNLETKIVTVNFKDGQSLNDETLTKIITDSGYEVESIRRVE